MQGNNPPRNCTQAFSKEGDQIFTNRSYTADQSRANLLSKDVEEGIRCASMGILFEVLKSLKITQLHVFLSGTCRGR